MVTYTQVRCESVLLLSQRDRPKPANPPQGGTGKEEEEAPSESKGSPGAPPPPPPADEKQPPSESKDSSDDSPQQEETPVFLAEVKREADAMGWAGVVAALKQKDKAQGLEWKGLREVFPELKDTLGTKDPIQALKEEETRPPGKVAELTASVAALALFAYQCLRYEKNQGTPPPGDLAPYDYIRFNPDGTLRSQAEIDQILSSPDKAEANFQLMKSYNATLAPVQGGKSAAQLSTFNHFLFSVNHRYDGTRRFQGEINYILHADKQDVMLTQKDIMRRILKTDTQYHQNKDRLELSKPVVNVPWMVGKILYLDRKIQDSLPQLPKLKLPQVTEASVLLEKFEPIFRKLDVPGVSLETLVPELAQAAQTYQNEAIRTMYGFSQAAGDGAARVVSGVEKNTGLALSSWPQSITTDFVPQMAKLYENLEKARQYLPEMPHAFYSLETLGPELATHASRLAAISRKAVTFDTSFSNYTTPEKVQGGNNSLAATPEQKNNTLPDEKALYGDNPLASARKNVSQIDSVTADTDKVQPPTTTTNLKDLFQAANELINDPDVMDTVKALGGGGNGAQKALPSK